MLFKIPCIHNKCTIPLILFALLSWHALGQNQKLPIPQLPTIKPPAPSFNMGPFSLPTLQSEAEDDMYLQDLREYERIQRSNQMLQPETESFGISYPSFVGYPGTDIYFNALEEISKMLREEIPFNLKRAVFTVENAYFQNGMKYEDFDKEIAYLAQLCRLKTAEKRLDHKNNMVKNMMIFQLMTDTFIVKDPAVEKGFITHMPMKYDFDDFRYKQDFSKSFVSKLLGTNSGQCHSMPLLYLILAEESGAEAFLSNGPNHLFIKLKDENGKWYNLELTSGCMPSDAHYMASGYIKAEALRNKLYLEPLSRKDILAQLLSDLAMEYIRQYGYDDFSVQASDTALNYSPHCISARIIKENLWTARTMYVVKRTGARSEEELQHFPQAYRLLLELKNMYKELDDLGYEPIPDEIYQTWLENMNKEMQKPEYRNRSGLKTTIE